MGIKLILLAVASLVLSTTVNAALVYTYNFSNQMLTPSAYSATAIDFNSQVSREAWANGNALNISGSSVQALLV